MNKDRIKLKRSNAHVICKRNRMQSILVSVVAKETICHSQIIFTISKNSYAIHKKSSEMLNKGQRMNDEYKHTLYKKFKFTFNSMLKS